MKNVFFCFIILFVHALPIQAREQFEKEKGIELEERAKAVVQARARIRAASTVKARDFLRLMPGITISQHDKYSELGKSELYFGASISTSSIFDIADNAQSRKVLKTKALRKVQSIGFIIKKLILKKYLMKERMWKLSQMRGSMDSPVDIAGIDEKIDVLSISLQEIEIDIERQYAEMDYVCVEVEG